MLLQTKIYSIFTKYPQTCEEHPLTPELVSPPHMLVLLGQVAAQSEVITRHKARVLLHDVCQDLSDSEKLYLLLSRK